MSYPVMNEHLIEIKAANHHLAKQAPLFLFPHRCCFLHLACTAVPTMTTPAYPHASAAERPTKTQKQTVHSVHSCPAGLEVIPDLEVPFPSDDAPEPDVVPSSPQPPGFSGQKSPECELLCLCCFVPSAACNCAA